MPNDIKIKLLLHFAFFGIETWMFASIFSHLTSKALTVVFQARGVIVYGSDQEVRCWKSLFVCLYGFIGTRRLEYLNKETFGLKQVVNLLFITPSFKQENRLIKRRQFL